MYLAKKRVLMNAKEFISYYYISGHKEQKEKIRNLYQKDNYSLNKKDSPSAKKTN